MNDELDDMFPEFPSDDEGLQSLEALQNWFSKNNIFSHIPEDLPKEQSMKLRVDVIISLLRMSTINEISYIRRDKKILLTVDLDVQENNQDEPKLYGPEQA